jgi:hypothetical protein
VSSFHVQPIVSVPSGLGTRFSHKQVSSLRTKEGNNLFLGGIKASLSSS